MFIFTRSNLLGSISCDPNFAYDGDPNIVIYHLMPDSPCIDKGHPSLDYADQNDLDTEPREMGTYVDMGADEICPDCDDVYNPFDWNADGLVNYDEFNCFSRAWLSWNPYLLDPNCPDYGNYTFDPNDCIRWDNRCNLVATGTSQYMIDLEDLLEFIGQSPDTDHWLWWACWRMDIWNALEQQAQQSMMMSMSSSGLMTEPVTLQSESTVERVAVTESAAGGEVDEGAILPSETVEEVNPVTERATLLSLIEDIQVFIDAGGEDAETWKEIEIILKQSLVEIEDMITGDAEI